MPTALPQPLVHAPSDFARQQARAAAVLDRQLFFIASCSKSGSTWLQHVLDGHPQICCHGEAFFPTFLRPLLESVAKQYNPLHKCNHTRNQAARCGDLTPEHIQHLYREAVGLIMHQWLGEKAQQIRAIGDKTPENATSATSLYNDFPTCRIIHLIRDGRDVCVSGWFHNLREKPDTFSRQFPSLADYIPLMAAQKWVPYINAARAAGAAHPQQYLEVRYEDLHQRPAETVARLLNFLQVDVSDELIAACREAGDFRRLSGQRDRGQTDNSAFYRNGQVGDWREHFDQRGIDAFKRAAGDMLESLGYSW